MSETTDLRDYERQLLDYIERGGSAMPVLRNPILDRVVNPDDYELDEDEPNGC